MLKLTEAASGVFVIAVTPFLPNGALDLESTDRMVDFYLEIGAAGLTILGMMGEANKLTMEESQLLVRRILARVHNRVPVVVGVSAPGFSQIQTLSSAVMDDGAAGVMIAPSSILRTDDQIANYFLQASEFIGGAPFVLQDFPLSTNVQISVSTIARIVNALPDCVCLKHEDWPGLEKISALRTAGLLSRRISILCGNGGLFLPEELKRGADGAMTGFAYPEMMVEVIRHHLLGEDERVHHLFDAYLPLARFEQQPGMGLAVRKYVLFQRGVIAHPHQRKPGAPLSATGMAEVNHLIQRQTRRLKELN